MAVETLILRPTSSAVSKIGSLDVVFSTNPPDTPVEDFHLLVSEEVPDEGATYVGIASAALLCFGFLVPEKYAHLTPLSIRFYLRIIQSAQASVTYNVYADPDISNSSDNPVKLASVASSASDPSSEYYTLVLETTQEAVSTVWGVMANNSNYAPYICIDRDVGEKNETSKLTQFYVEVDFETDDGTTATPEILIKRDGAWLSVAQQFQKVDGAWIEITSAEAKELLMNSAVEVTS